MDTNEAKKLLRSSGYLVIAREHMKTIGASFHVDSHMALRHKDYVVSSMKHDACRALAEKLFREVKFTEMPVEGSEYGPLVSEYRATINIFDKSVSDPFLEMLRDEQR